MEWDALPKSNICARPLNRISSYHSLRHLLKSSASSAHSSLEPPLEYNQDRIPLTNQDSL